MGFSVVTLTTKGAKSGRQRTAQINGFADGENAWLVVASNAGADTNPAWFVNMVKNPDDIWLKVGRRNLKARGEVLSGAARLAALRGVAAMSPQYGEYQEGTEREIPVIRLTADQVKPL
jgi:deazaflavin-dependent oxidoreductase (nitroreductase family)